MARLTPGQINYWRRRLGRPNLTAGQASYHRARATATPGAPPAPSSTAAAPQPPRQATPSPLDSQYFASQAQRQFQANTQLGELDRQAGYDRTDFDEALRRMREQKPREQDQARSSRNRQGLFFSGHLGQDLGDIETQHVRQESDARQAFERRERAREEARWVIREGGSLEEAAERAAAVDRQLQRDQEAAADRALAPEVDPVEAAAQEARTAPKSYLPAGYMNWSPQMKSRYWARRRRERAR
jgi:hypothetical protein